MPHRRAPLALFASVLAALVAPGCDGSSAATGVPAALGAPATGGEHPADPRLLAELASLQAAVQQQPDQARTRHRLGEVLALLGRPEEALPHYERAVALLPDDGALAMATLSLQVRLGHGEDAAALLPHVLAREDLGGEALHQLALLLDYEGQRELAGAVIERAARLPAADAAPCRALDGRFRFEAGDFAGARERFAAALAGQPDSLEALKGLADASRRLGQADAAAHWDEVLQLMLTLQDDEYIRKRGEQRRAALERLLEVHPAWTGGWRQLAGMLDRAGDADGACRLVRELLERHAELVAPAEAAALRERFCP